MNRPFESRIRAIRRYVAPLVTPEGVVAVKMTVKETVSDKQPNPIYSVETIETAKPALDAPQSGIERAPVDRNAPQAGFNSKIVAALNIVKNGASKVVDEAGEPLVSWHGTPSRFTVFDASRKGERDSGDLGKGFYFGSETLGEMYRSHNPGQRGRGYNIPALRVR